jgi:phosphatidylinositol-binding clathrin assembly protein
VGYVQPAPNPFAQYQQPQMAMQPTGFLVPQQTAVPPPNPFVNFLGKQPQQQPTHQPFSSFITSQPTGFQQLQQPQQQPTHQPYSSYITSQPTGFQQLQQPQMSGFPQPPQQNFLQPQPTGINPFRQSMLVPQSTGMALFGVSSGQFAPNGNQSSQGNLGVSAFSQPPTPAMHAPTPPVGASSNNTPARPSSTPLTSFAASSQALQPVKSHQTGTRNPFGPIISPPPPVPKAPTLLELTTGKVATNGNVSRNQQSAQQQLPQQQTGAFNKFSFNNSTLNPGATDISSVASSFTFNPNAVGSTTSEKSSSNSSGFMGSQQTGNTTMGSTLSDSRLSFPLPQSTNTSTPTTMSGSPSVTSHVTGSGGLKPFIPSSSFGASLMESLSIPGFGPTNPTTSGTTTNAENGLATSSGGSSSSNGTGNHLFLNSQPTGATGGFSGTSSTYKSSLGVGLRPQMTGGGAANPFRASSVGGPNFGTPTSFQSTQPLGANIFGMNGGAFGTQGQQPQPYGTAS